MTKVLVTGANGFIGSALMERLQYQGLDTIPYTKSCGDISEVSILDPDISHIFHLAAKTSVPESWYLPKDYYKINVQGTIQVLELCRRNHCGLTFMSTYVYGRPESTIVNETHPVRAMSPYHHSKIMAEDVCKFYSENYEVPVTIIRPFNIYGPNQKANFIIPTILNQLMDPDLDVIEVMDLNPKRDYVYIDDLIDVLMLTIGKSGLSTYNVGSGSSASVEDLIQMLMEIMNRNKNYRSKEIQRRNEVSDIVADISRINKDLDWSPRFSLFEGLTDRIAKLKGR